MSLSSALCSILVGISLWLLSGAKSDPHVVKIAAAPAAGTCALAGVVVLGTAGDFAAHTFSWGDPRSALLTGSLFLSLGIATLLVVQGRSEMVWVISRAQMSLFVTGLALLIGLSMVTYLRTIQFFQSAETLDHIRQESRTLRKILNDLLDADVGMRGYLLTGNAAFLRPYELARADWQRRLREARAYRPETPDRRKDYEELDAIFAEKFARMQKAIALRARASPDPETLLVRTGADVDSTEEIRQRITRRLLYGNVTLQEIRRETDARVMRMFYILPIGTVLSLVLMALFVFQLNVEAGQRQQAENEVQRAKEDLEERVRLRTAELEAANREMEAFTYSVSHDLRGPVRHMSAFAHLLMDSNAGSLNEEGRTYARKISDNADELGQLMDSLLQFSRLSRTGLRREPVDLDRLVRKARAQSESEASGRKIEWELDPLPLVLGDPHLLQIVVTNLISNAVKFTRHCGVARIEVRCSNGEPGHIIVTIRDNGAGFDMAHAQKLYGVFQRLHTHAEFEGTGIGLASAKRIIERHGGNIWASSAPGAGATFSFSLPRAEARTNSASPSKPA